MNQSSENNRPTTYPPDWDVPFSPAAALPQGYLTGRETKHLAAGTVFIEGGKPLPRDVVWEQDVEITLRDGVVIYTDVLRPADQETDLPAIISWSAYGKSLPTTTPYGVPKENFSGLAKFEGADGAFWLDHGYALVNPDVRGAGRSGGDIQYWGSVDANDGYDVIEWVAEQPWSSGKVALYGASWLAFTQWGIAATRPPHLAAIAPWNGIYDPFRTHLRWGGIPDPGFFSFLPYMIPGGESKIEDISAMALRNGLLDDYWRDKAPDLSQVDVPAYVVVDGVTGLHSMGGPEAFRRLGSDSKWLRLNNTQEWYDQYSDEYQNDALRFFDHFLKGIDNGWEQTPRVRASIINAGGDDLVDVPFAQWPPADTAYEKLYLHAGAGALSTTPPDAASSTSYDAEDGSASFTFPVTEEMTLVGYLSVRLWVQAQGADDMDLFVLMEKLDEEGNLLAPHREFADTYPISPPGAPGRLRASMRELDDELSTDFLPVHSFRSAQKLAPDEVVAVDIPLTPRAYRFEPGQQIRLTVAGWNIRGTGVELDSVAEGGLRGGRRAAAHPPTLNQGTHVIHSGPERLSYLRVPRVTTPR
ncbi:CocE/NonD family hydrolase [Microbacterium sp. NPDC058062]|uniref:CocE/NonD family hydrolase n=1 Tax=Microbacterium sp. NPDC058062 TaxID=3346320 RepID=UPI0036DBE350